MLTALLGATLKDAGGQLTLQAQTDEGIVDLLVADYKGGELRGYVRFDRERLAAEPGVHPSLEALDHPEWDHVRILGETIRAGELTDPALPLEDLLWRLFHDEEEVRLLSAAPLARGCRCNAAHIRSVLVRFAPEERAEMADEAGNIGVDCEFCSKVFVVANSDLDA